MPVERLELCQLNLEDDYSFIVRPMPINFTAVRTVVVPAAGMGTRFLPATKTVPKELLPVVDTPGIEMIAEEAAAAGASRLAIVTSPSKDEVMRHFDEFPELVEILRDRGKDEQAAKVQRTAENSSSCCDSGEAFRARTCCRFGRACFG